MHYPVETRKCDFYYVQNCSRPPQPAALWQAELTRISLRSHHLNVRNDFTFLNQCRFNHNQPPSSRCVTQTKSPHLRWGTKHGASEYLIRRCIATARTSTHAYVRNDIKLKPLRSARSNLRFATYHGTPKTDWWYAMMINYDWTSGMTLNYWNLFLLPNSFPPRRIAMKRTSVETVNYHLLLRDASTSTGNESFLATATTIFETVVRYDDNLRQNLRKWH